MSHRIAFDTSLPLVAGTNFSAGEASFVVGDPIDWKKLGISELVVFEWWRSGMVYHPLSVAAEAPAHETEPAHDDDDAPHAHKPKPHSHKAKR